MRRRRVGADGKPRKGTAHERRPAKRAIWDSPAYRAARIVVFQRDGYICRFCGNKTVPRHRKLKPTAAHYPLSVEELAAKGIDPCSPDTMVTAHATCHGRQDAERQHAS